MGLARAVERGRTARFAAPLTCRQRESFQRVARLASAHAGPVWLDAGCGTGGSTVTLARRHPEVLVIGVDKSGHRLERCPELPVNAHLVRGELVSLWRQAAAAELRFDRQWLLYPNPWPKPGQLRRRWHGHPVFGCILAAGPIELRTNWRIYAEELAMAASIMGGQASEVERLPIDRQRPLSPFEAKYGRSGHALWRVQAGAAG